MKKKKVFGKELVIPANAAIIENGPGFTQQFYCKSVEVLIGIGKDHTASLTMDKESWEALKKGEKIHISEGAAVI